MGNRLCHAGETQAPAHPPEVLAVAKEADEVEQCGEVSPHNSSEYPELGQLATADSLVYRPPSRVSRLEKSKHLDIDEEILRGADLHRTLRHFGKVWQKPPSHLNHRDRTALWSYSTPVRGFDTFLSHTWLTPGRWKVLALTLQGGWPVMLMCWAIVTALTTALYAFGIISMPYTITAHYEDFQKVCPLGPWLVLSGFPALMLGMVVSPYVPIAQQIAFVDMFSIHQTDPELMERGIYGIGGCLRRSQQLKVLWSPPYLSRLWCIFEIAAFRKVNQFGDIQWIPLFRERAFLVLLFLCFWMTLLFWIFEASQAAASSRIAAYGSSMIICGIGVHAFRHSVLEGQQLLNELQHFDLKAAGCTLEFDRKFIHSAIQNWYESEEAFIHYVRGPLREELAASASFPV